MDSKKKWRDDIKLMNNIKNIKQKILDNAQYPLIASVRKKGPIAFIINLAAKLRGLTPWSHTFYIYVRNKEIYYYEITIFGGVRSGFLEQKYLKDKYKGCIQVHVIPYEKKYIETFSLHKKYSVIMALLSWLGNRRIVDSDIYGYCSDESIDVSESTIDTQIVQDNFRYTPSLLNHIFTLRKYKCIKY